MLDPVFTGKLWKWEHWAALPLASRFVLWWRLIPSSGRTCPESCPRWRTSLVSTLPCSFSHSQLQLSFLCFELPSWGGEVGFEHVALDGEVKVLHHNFSLNLFDLSSVLLDNKLDCCSGLSPLWIFSLCSSGFPVSAFRSKRCLDVACRSPAQCSSWSDTNHGTKGLLSKAC